MNLHKIRLPVLLSLLSWMMGSAVMAQDETDPDQPSSPPVGFSEAGENPTINPSNIPFVTTDSLKSGSAYTLGGLGIGIDPATSLNIPIRDGPDLNIQANYPPAEGQYPKDQGKIDWYAQSIMTAHVGIPFS